MVVQNYTMSCNSYAVLAIIRLRLQLAMRLGQMKIFRTMHFVPKLFNLLQYATMWHPLH